MSEVTLSIIGYIIGFVIFTIRMDKRVSLLEQSMQQMAANMEKYSDLQIRLTRQEITVDQLQRSMEEIRDEYRQLASRLGKN